MAYILVNSLDAPYHLSVEDLRVFQTWDEANKVRWDSDYWYNFDVREIEEGKEFYIVQPAGFFEQGMISDATVLEDEVDAYVALSEFVVPMEVVRVRVGQSNLEGELLAASI